MTSPIVLTPKGTSLGGNTLFEPFSVRISATVRPGGRDQEKTKQYGRGASSHIIWCNNLYPVQSYWHFSEIQDGSRRHLGFSVHVNLAIPAVDIVVFVFCTKLGSNICYSHWDRRTYASDIHLMTSRELTSAFDFWSRGHLYMAVMHLPIKFGADVFIQSGVIDIFPKLKMAAAAILDLFGWAVEPPTKPRLWCVPAVKILSWSPR